MLTLEEMFTPLTRDEVFDSFIGVAEAVGLPISAWQPGSVVREILVVVAQKIADLTQITSAIARGGLLDYATGGWLTLLALAAYGLTRIPATFGTGTIDMSNSSGIPYTIVAGDLHFIHNTTGKTYTNTSGGSLAASGGTLTVDIIADESGTDSNAIADSIDALVTPLLGVTVTNPDALTAADEEEDDQLKLRCRESLASMSPNGPRDAYNFFAKSATRPSNGTNVGVTRTKVVQTSGSVTVYVASSSGEVTGTAGDPSTDLGAVNLNIQTNCVPTGTTATLVSATELPLLFELTVYLGADTTLSAGNAKTLILEQLQNYFKDIPIGGYDIGAGGKIFFDAVIGQVYQAAPDDIIEVVIDFPGGVEADVLFNEVATLTTALSDITIVNT